jgi:hypothetical protein
MFAGPRRGALREPSLVRIGALPDDLCERDRRSSKTTFSPTTATKARSCRVHATSEGDGRGAGRRGPVIHEHSTSVRMGRQNGDVWLAYGAQASSK